MAKLEQTVVCHFRLLHRYWIAARESEVGSPHEGIMAFCPSRG